MQKIKIVSSAVKGINIYMKTVIEKRPDIVLSFLTYTNLLALICQRTFFRKIPLIVSERNDPCVRKSKAQRKIVDWLYPKADCIVCQGNRVEDYFKSINQNARTCIIPNPINSECICREEPEQRQKKIIAVGRLSQQKNYDLLIDSFYKFNQQNDEYVVEIYGQGPEEGHLLEKIASLGLEEKIHLMGTIKNVMKRTYQASLYVMSSNFEGFPNALLEAMASGLPAICTDYPTGTVHDLIINGVNGYIVPMNNREKMIAAIHSILDDSMTVDRMGNEAKKVNERFEVKEIVEQWEALFCQLTLS
jgi:glycosyltransferase involved in cell wall biosynthesis